MEGLLLAAGAGRRMGTPKALVSDDAGSWLLRGITCLYDGGCARVSVVLGAEAERARAVVSGPAGAGPATPHRRRGGLGRGHGRLVARRPPIARRVR